MDSNSDLDFFKMYLLSITLARDSLLGRHLHMPAVKCVKIGVVKHVIQQHSITSRFSLAHVRSLCVGLAWSDHYIAEGKENSYYLLPDPLWDVGPPVYTSDSLSRSQSGGQGRRASVSPHTEFFRQLLASAPSFPSHSHHRRASTLTHTISLSSLPQTHPGSDP